MTFLQSLEEISVEEIPCKVKIKLKETLFFVSLKLLDLNSFMQHTNFQSIFMCVIKSYKACIKQKQKLFLIRVFLYCYLKEYNFKNH